MQFFVLTSPFIWFLVLMPGLAVNEDTGTISGIALNKSTTSEPIISPGLSTSFSTQSSSIATVKSTIVNVTADLQTAQNISSTEEIPLDVSNTTAYNDSMIPRRANEPSGTPDNGETSSAVYYFQIILIVLCTLAVVAIAVYLTRQLNNGRFRRKFRSSGRRGTIGKRYSDISLQLLNRESGILDLPNISEEGESHVVAGKAEVVEYFMRENDSPIHSPPLTPTTENGSLKSADGVWL